MTKKIENSRESVGKIVVVVILAGFGIYFLYGPVPSSSNDLYWAIPAALVIYFLARFLTKDETSESEGDAEKSSEEKDSKST